MSNNHHASAGPTADPVRASQHHATDRQIPEFLRLPRAGTRCFLTGLSRATLNALILGDRPRVKSRGIRLIVTSSLLEFLYEHVGRVNTLAPEDMQ